MVTYNTIRLTNYSTVQKELKCAEAIVPGMLAKRNTDGEAIKHDASAQYPVPMYLFEDELQGNGIDTQVESGEPGQFIIPNRGDVIQAILADGEDVSIGDLLESNGDGSLKKGSTKPVAIALEAIDLSDTSGPEDDLLGYDERIVVESL